MRETEVAERAKAVEVVKAREVAEKQAISVTVAAEAEKQASEDKAEAVTIMANADADKERIEAQANADAVKLIAAADEKRYEVEAAGKQSINEASNTLSVEQIAMQVKLELLKQMPEIIRQSVKPMEQIDGIKIIQVDGLNAGSVPGSDGAAEGRNGNLADQVVSSALRYRGQAPLVDSLLAEVGLDANSLKGLSGGVGESYRNGESTKE